MKNILNKILKIFNYKGYKKLLPRIKNFMVTKKLLSVIILSAIIASIAIGVLIIDKINMMKESQPKINKPIFTVSIEPNGNCLYDISGKIYPLTDMANLYKYSGISNFYLTTVSGVYKISKDYLVYKENLDSLPSSVSGTIISDIYSVIPKNGENILSMQPIYITFRLPGTIEKDKANYQIVRISDNSNLIPLKGGYLHSDGSHYYITAKVYHLSKFALKYTGSINIKKSYGLKEVYSVETRGAGRPVLIIGGMDKNIYDVDYWMNVFPNRSIWFYYYPTSETRSLIYQDSIDNLWQADKEYIASKYKITLSRESYIISQASLLKQELLSIKETKKYINFDIIANGIGGLIARWSLEALPKTDEITNVKNLYLIDVPNNGLASIDPNKLKDIYGSSNTFIKKQYNILDIDQVKWFANRLTTMLDSYSPFIQDIIPSSETIAILNKATPLNKNIEYHNFCGIRPIFNIKYIPGSRIEDDFPLFVQGKGDGKLSIYDANIKGLKLVTLNSNFLQVYQNKDFILYAKTGYIDNENEKIAKLQTDINIVKPTQGSSNIANTKTFKNNVIEISQKNTVFKQLYSVHYNCQNYRIFNGKKYFIYSDKIIDENNNFLKVNGYITDVKYFNNNLYILDFSKSVVYVVNGNLHTINKLYLSKNSNSIYQMQPTNFGIFYYNLIDKTVYIYRNQGYASPYIKLSAPVLSIEYNNQRILIQTRSDLRIFDINSGSVLYYYSVADFNSVPKSFGNIRAFISSYLNQNQLYMISDNYTLFAVNLDNPYKISRMSRIGESNGRFTDIKNITILVGRKVITAYSNIQRLPWFYKTKFEISDFFSYNGNLYLITKDPNGIIVRKMSPNWR